MTFLYSTDFFCKKSFRNTLVKQLESRHIVRPDLGLNCLKWLSADHNCWQRVKMAPLTGFIQPNLSKIQGFFKAF